MLRLAFLALACVCITACNSDPVPTTSTSAPDIDRQLIIEANHVYGPLTRSDSLLPNVTVKLFTDILDREEDEDVVRILTTDSTGRVTFRYLTSEKTYFLRIEHPDFETRDEQFTYPKGAVTAYEFYDFY